MKAFMRIGLLAVGMSAVALFAGCDEKTAPEATDTVTEAALAACAAEGAARIKADGLSPLTPEHVDTIDPCASQAAHAAVEAYIDEMMADVAAEEQ